MTDATNSIRKTLEKRYGKGVATVPGADQEPPAIVALCSSGYDALDAALGIGGYPRGRIVELFGPESSGKTTLALRAIAEVQKAGAIAAFVDAEHAFDPDAAVRLGVDPARLLVSQPDSGEQSLDIVETLVRTGALGLVVVDSVAALVPQAEIEGDAEASAGLHARLMSQALRKITAVAHKTGTTVLFVNQLRQKIGVVFGNPESTAAANALKFYASVRLDVRRSEYGVTVRVVKNKCAAPFRQAFIVMATAQPHAHQLCDYEGCDQQGDWVCPDGTPRCHFHAAVTALCKLTPEDAPRAWRDSMSVPDYEKALVAAYERLVGVERVEET